MSIGVVELPAMLTLPKKLVPVIDRFNDFLYFLLEGGRGGAKTQTIARILLYIAEKRKVRIVCGRETQNTIEESVYTVFKDIIEEHQLNYQVFKDRIVHRTTGSEIRFKGFREQGAINIKGLEGTDILWIDESQAVTKNTLDIIIPTIRKQNSKVIFTMNRYLRTDAVYTGFAHRDDCLTIKINYSDNPFCPQKLIDEATRCKEEAPEDYKHIWMGEPLAEADNLLFNQEKLEESENIEFSYDISKYTDRLMGWDIARFGRNWNAIIVMKQEGPDHWSEENLERWQKQDTMYSTGRFIDVMGQWQPSKAVIDADGMGDPLHDRLVELKIPHVAFHGGHVDTPDPVRFKNWRTYGYLILNDMVNRGRIRIKSAIIRRQLAEIRFTYDSTGRKYIIPKEQLIDAARRKGVKFESPDEADALMMAMSQAEILRLEQTKQYVTAHPRTDRNQSRYAYEDNILA